MRRRGAAAVIALACLGACRRDAPPAPRETSTQAVASTEREPPAVASTPAAAPSTSASAAAAPACPVGYRCGSAPSGAAVDLILVEKRAHRLFLISGNDVLETYSVAIGPGGYGPKGYEGDKVTPTGSYTVTATIKQTKWHTYLALDYPNEEDKRRYAELVAQGKAPPKVGAGSGIAIHGRKADMPDGLHKLVDWTLGCVALDNDEIDEVASRVTKGTRVLIRD